MRGHDHLHFHVLGGPIEYGLPEWGEKLLVVVHTGLHDRPNLAAEYFGGDIWVSLQRQTSMKTRLNLPRT